MDEQNRSSVLAPGEQARIDAALDLLETDNHAPREITVRYVLHVHHEYPKAVGDKIVNNAWEEMKNAEEENALLARAAADAVVEPAAE
jgi:hypothetical protein